MASQTYSGSTGDGYITYEETSFLGDPSTTW